MENNALHFVPVGAVFQLGGAPPHFSSHVGAFLYRKRPPDSPDWTPLDIFF